MVKRKKAMSTEDIAKDMDHLILLFGMDKNMKSLITAHLVCMGWDKKKAISYASLVEKYTELKQDGVSIW